MGEILLGIGICRNMQKLSHNKGGMNMYEPSTDWFGYVLSLSDDPHGGGMGFNFVAISWRPFGVLKHGWLNSLAPNQIDIH